MMRSDRVPLPAHEPRCEPRQPGRAASRCARHLASVPHGSVMQDFTASTCKPCTALCIGYIDLAVVRLHGLESRKPNAKPFPSGDT